MEEQELLLKAGKVWDANTPKSLQLDTHDLLDEFDAGNPLNRYLFEGYFFRLAEGFSNFLALLQAVFRSASPMPCISGVLM